MLLTYVDFKKEYSELMKQSKVSANPIEFIFSINNIKDPFNLMSCNCSLQDNNRSSIGPAEIVWNSSTDHSETILEHLDGHLVSHRISSHQLPICKLNKCSIS